MCQFCPALQSLVSFLHGVSRPLRVFLYQLFLKPIAFLSLPSHARAWHAPALPAFLLVFWLCVLFFPVSGVFFALLPLFLPALVSLSDLFLPALLPLYLPF